MNVKTFVERPVLSAVISILIVLLGVIGLKRFLSNNIPTLRRLPLW